MNNERDDFGGPTVGNGARRKMGTVSARWGWGWALLGMLCATPAPAATRAEAEFAAGWDALVGYCGALQPGGAPAYKGGLDSVFKNASSASLAQARSRPEYRPRYDATLRQLKRTAPAAISTTCNAWVASVGGAATARGDDRKKAMPAATAVPK